jgi:hypothetical protein
MCSAPPGTSIIAWNQSQTDSLGALLRDIAGDVPQFCAEAQRMLHSSKAKFAPNLADSVFVAGFESCCGAATP